MKIIVTNIGKRFNREWIFRHLDFEFTNGYSYAIIGPNGSGKSTLLQVIAGAMAESEGKISYEMPVVSHRAVHSSNTETATNSSLSGLRPLSPDFVYQNISIATPYLELIEEMTLTEFLQFHQIFKPFISGIDLIRIISEIGLQKSAHKQIRYFSSGMKQRVKLAQAFFSATPVLMLDEPCTNLDEEGVAMYHQLIKTYAKDRIVIISSNDLQEYDFCRERINMNDYKK